MFEHRAIQLHFCVLKQRLASFRREQVGTLPGGEQLDTVYGSSDIIAHLFFSLEEAIDKTRTFGHFSLLVERSGNSPKHMDLPRIVT